VLSSRNKFGKHLKSSHGVAKEVHSSIIEFAWRGADGGT
jgi:hypothetical protein